MEALIGHGHGGMPIALASLENDFYCSGYNLFGCVKSVVAFAPITHQLRLRRPNSYWLQSFPTDQFKKVIMDDFCSVPSSLSFGACSALSYSQYF